MQGRWPAGPPCPHMAPCRARSIGGLWALGPPTTAAQNLAELLLRVCGCRYVILMVARFKKFCRGPGADLAIRSRWPTSEAALMHHGRDTIYVISSAGLTRLETFSHFLGIGHTIDFSKSSAWCHRRDIDCIDL